MVTDGTQKLQVRHICPTHRSSCLVPLSLFRASFQSHCFPDSVLRLIFLEDSTRAHLWVFPLTCSAFTYPHGSIRATCQDSHLSLSYRADPKEAVDENRYPEITAVKTSSHGQSNNQYMMVLPSLPIRPLGTYSCVLCCHLPVL